jgi:hypothetical protein
MESVLPAGAHYQGACVRLVLMGKQEQFYLLFVVIDKYSISFLKQEFYFYFKLFHFEIRLLVYKITRFLSWLFFARLAILV